MRKSNPKQCLSHDLRPNIDVLDVAVEGFGKLFGHLPVRQCLWASEVIDPSLVPFASQCRSRDGGNIADIYGTDLRVAGSGEEFPLPHNGLPKTEQPLHKEIWPQEGISDS